MAISGIGGPSFSPSTSFSLSLSQRSITNELSSDLSSILAETDSSNNISQLSSSSEDGVRISARLGDVSRATRGASLSTLFTIGLAQANESQLKSIKNTLGDLKELSQKAESTTLSSDERSVITDSFNDLRTSLKNTLQDAAFNGTKIFQNKTIETVVNENGITEEFSLKNLSLSDLGISASSVADSTNAKTTTTSLTSAEEKVDERLAFVDSQLSKFSFHITNTLNERSVVGASSQSFSGFGSSGSTSQIASEILSSASVASQANTNRTTVLDLLGEPVITAF